VTGDPNEDGKLDLLVSTIDSTVAVLVNRGKGNFREGVEYPTDRDPFAENAGIPVSVASGDLNGDGRPDLVTVNDFENNVSVLINRPGLCAVQDVEDETLPDAKREITRSGCRVGKISRRYTDSPAKGLVISEKPKFGAVLRSGSRVNLVISRDPKHP
jgi:FG-GAP-like repeat/PASTA domain